MIIWAAFARKFLPKTFEKLPNLVTLSVYQAVKGLLVPICRLAPFSTFTTFLEKLRDRTKHVPLHYYTLLSLIQLFYLSNYICL